MNTPPPITPAKDAPARAATMNPDSPNWAEKPALRAWAPGALSWSIPPRPAMAPVTSITVSIRRRTRMPANPAARGLPPMVSIS